MNKIIISKKKKEQLHETKKDIFIYNEIETIKKIKEGYSIARFGDHELFMLTGDKNQFQDYYEEIHKYLIEILENDNPQSKLLIGIPPLCLKRDPNIKSEGIQDYWNRWVRHRKLGEYIIYLKDNTYYSSFFTQLYAYDKYYVKKIMTEIVDLWNNKNIVLFLNSQVKEKCADVIDKLFQNVQSIKFEIVPSKNAWATHTDILNKIKSYDNICIILICCGVTATVIAYKATIDGYQVIDFGQFIECIHAKYLDLL